MASPSHLDGEPFPVSPPDCQTFLASFAQATWEADVSGQVITDSPNWRAYTGQTFTEFSGMGWANAISPGDRAEVIHSWREAVARLKAFSAEFRVKSVDDSWHWCNMQAAPIPNADGSIRNWLAIFTDMEGGGRHKADEKLHQATLDSSTDMIQVFKAVRDEAGEIVDFTWILNNHASEKFYGDVIGKSLLQLQPGVVQEGIFDAFKHVVETGAPQQYEKHYVHEQFNGWFHQSVVKLNDGVATTTSDITKLKITEQQLRVAKENLQTTLDSSQYVIQAFTAVRNEAGKIIDFVWVFTNRTWNQLYGEMAGKSLLQENPGVIETGLFDKFVQVTEEGAIIDHEQYYSHEQFNGQWFHQTLVKMGDGFVMNTEDITQRKKDEAEILRLKDEIAQRATDRYQTIFNSIDEGFCIYELIYNEKGNLVDLEWIEVNPAYEKQTGLKDVVGKRHSDLLFDTEDYWYEIYQTVSQTGEPSHFEQWHQPTGRWYRTYATRIGDVNTRRVAVVFDDITERKQREEQQKFLLRLSDEFRELTDGTSIKEHAVKLLAGHLGLDRCWVSEVFETEGFSTVGPEQVRPGLSPMSGVFQLSDYPETMQQLMTELMMVDDSAADPRFGEAEKSLLSSINLNALLVVPLRKGGQQVIWALAAAMSTSRHWTQNEQTLMEDVAERTWEAVERAETERHVRESEKRLRIATEAADMATWEWDLVRNRVVWNERHFRIFGLEPGGGPIRPETFFEHVHPADRERVDQLLRASMRDDVEFDTEFRAILQDGSERWMSGYGRVMERSGGEPLSMSGVMFDITARRQAEQDLQHSEARQNAILESAKDYAIIALDLDLRVNHWNAGAEYMLGYSEEEIIGQSGEIFFVPEDRAKGAHEIEKENAIKDGRATNERWHLRKDGSRFYGSGVTRPLLNEAGTAIGLLKVMRDLTHEKRSEDALKEANRRKDEFLAMLAHELRNPLSTVRNGVAILKLTQQPDSQLADVVHMMDNHTTHLVRMIDDLLDVSRVTQGKIELKTERLEISTLISEAVKAIQPQYKSRGKQLYVMQLLAGLYVEGDPTRLTQVITNLLTNGLRYTGDDGQVWVSLEIEKQEALIRVRDNGIGLTTEQQTSVFELFVQGDNSLARSQGGLGVGLTLVKRLVEMHGGKVEAESQGPGLGSEFLVYLPLLDLPAQERVSAPENDGDKRVPLRILVIDDIEDLAKLMSMLLTIKGYQVDICTSGIEGVKAVEKSKPSVVLCDIGMPGLDGYQTAQLIRQGEWGKQVILIALSGYAQPEDIEKSKEAGFDAHLAKPVDIGKLLNVILQLTSHDDEA